MKPRDDDDDEYDDDDDDSDVVIEDFDSDVNWLVKAVVLITKVERSWWWGCPSSTQDSFGRNCHRSIKVIIGT